MPWPFEVERQQETPRRSIGSPHRATSFLTQADALLRKNLTFQKRNLRANAGLVAFPVLLCLLLFTIQKAMDIAADPSPAHCGCQPCVDGKGEEQCHEECAAKLFQLMATGLTPCPEPKPTKWPTLLQLPPPQFRATRRSVSGGSTRLDSNTTDMPDGSFGRSQGTNPVTFLVTGHNRSLAQSKQ